MNAKARVAGWGRITDGGSTSNTLLEAKVNLLSDHVCKSSLIGEFYDTDSMLCAYKTKKDACQGDSGGPLFIETSLNRFEQVGKTNSDMQSQFNSCPIERKMMIIYFHLFNSQVLLPSVLVVDQPFREYILD